MTALLMVMAVSVGVAGIWLDRTSISGVSITFATLAVVSAHLDAARPARPDMARRGIR